MASLRVRTIRDGVLAAVAPLGLAAAAGTALMVDLDPDGPAYPGAGSLADLVARGPRRDDLMPRRAGVAVLRNGGVGEDDARQVLEAIAAGWPALVLRERPGLVAPRSGVVPVVAMWPGILSVDAPEPAVFQRTGFLAPPRGGGPILPRLDRRTLAGLLSGVLHPSRWIRAWRPVWEMAW